ncbi:MAG: GNAT family N-acetyltransferase [Catenulispora sp.]|nr:GNAT family N-acetyltransferase [Catenulispora sp.]
MSIEIRELDPALPRTITDLLPVHQASLAVDAPSYPRPTEGYLRLLTGPRPTQRRVFVAAYDAGTLIGYGAIGADVDANQDMFSGDLAVLPGRRADALVPLLDASKERARAHGAKRLVLAFAQAAPDYAPVFTAEGGRKVDIERRAQLDLKTVDREKYAAWAAPSEKNAHYRIRTWVGPTPEDLLPPLVLAAQAMRDAPTGDLEFDHPAPNVDRRRRIEQWFAAIGAHRHIIAAFTEDGTIAGLHGLFVVPGSPMAEISDTSVPAAFRGHGLGLRLKAAMTLRLLDSEPEIEVIGTWNNVDNAPMLRVNDALGFRTAEIWELWQFDL